MGDEVLFPTTWEEITVCFIIYFIYMILLLGISMLILTGLEGIIKIFKP